MINTFGMEFEIQGLSPAAASRSLNNAGIDCDGGHESSWVSKYDGSVSNGAEVISPILTAARLNEAHRVTKALKTDGARVDRATGFHVHIGIQSLGSSNEAVFQRTPASNLANLVINWYAAHHAIAALVAPSRLNNRYCKVLNEAQATEQASYSSNGNRGAWNGNRYVSLNLESMQRHGTVEARLHQGTLNGVKAIAWSQFIAAFIDATSNKGLNALDMVGISPYSHERGIYRSVNECHTLLDALVGLGSLNASTGDWLKNRADGLNR